MKNKIYGSQSGVALITVLLIFALLTVVLSGLIVSNNSDLKRVGSYLSTEQAYLLCLSGEEIARQLLAEDYKKSSTIDHVNEPWAKSGLVFEVDGGYFEVFIEDATGKFNLNNLATSNTGDIKQRDTLSAILDIGLNEKVIADEISAKMSDWVDLDKINGTEEFEYLSEEPSYRPPDGPVAGISEIRLLKGIDAETYKIMRDQVFKGLTALPAQTKININTITPLTLAGLGKMNLKAAETLVTTIRSATEGYSTPAQALAGIPGIDLASLDIKTDYFEVRVRAKFGEHYAYLRSLVFRDPRAEGRLEIISRDRSEKFVFPFSEDYNESRKSDDYEIDI